MKYPSSFFYHSTLLVFYAYQTFFYNYLFTESIRRKKNELVQTLYTKNNNKQAYIENSKKEKLLSL